jgi:predicted RNA binding protein YcfA (HicA-like mRNA interferase family)
MPPKIKDLIAELERNGFINRGGKGSHRNYENSTKYRVTVSGKLGNDAKKYQIKLVNDAIKGVKN